jgi:mRNA-degrading endonuclease RelE of RelBE toxin-antitoxin system
LGRFQVEIKEPAEKAIRDLAKKYRRIWDDLRPIFEALESHPRLGTALLSVTKFASKAQTLQRARVRGSGSSHGPKKTKEK